MPVLNPHLQTMDHHPLPHIDSSMSANARLLQEVVKIIACIYLVFFFWATSNYTYGGFRRRAFATLTVYFESIFGQLDSDQQEPLDEYDGAYDSDMGSTPSSRGYSPDTAIVGMPD